MVYEELEQKKKFKQVTPKKVSDFIAEQIEEAIILKEVLPEEQLPPERELCELFNASRLTVRDAIFQLQEKGLIEKRRGANGGTFVLPLTANIHEKRKIELKSHWSDFQQLFEFRNIIEPQAIRLATIHINDEQLERLQRLNYKISHICHREEFRSIDVQFHLLIAEASNNQYLYNAVRMIRTKINPGLDLLPYDEEVCRSSYHAHQEIIDSILDKDQDRAYELMYEHIQTTTQKLEQLLDVST